MESADRFEFKFVLSREQRQGLFAALGDRLEPDTHGSVEGAYPIVSLYYDTADRRCYWEAWRRAPSRRKLRVRIYGTPDGAIPPTSFVEIKHKLDGRGAKRRVQTTQQNALAIAAGGGALERFSGVELRTVEEVHHLVREEAFRPACMISYQRRAYALAVTALGEEAGPEPLRITFDEGVGARFRDLQPEPADSRCDFALLNPGQCLMEMKGSRAVPFALVRLLAGLGIQSGSFSKYRSAVERLLRTPSLSLSPTHPTAAPQPPLPCQTLRTIPC
jgi:hypothetical protein